MIEPADRSWYSGKRLYAPFLFSLVVFLAIELVEFTSPFSGYGNEALYYYFMLFYFLVGLPLLSPFLFIKYKKGLSSGLVVLCDRKLKKFMIFAFIGIVFIVFDRVFLQGVDYSHGISSARENWREVSTARSGVSSPFSVLGNLLYPLVFVSLILNVVFYENIRSPFLKLLSLFFIVALFSLVIGGRTSILVFLSVIFSSLATRLMLGLRFFPKGFLSRVTVIVGGALLFAGLIFYWRVQGSDVDFSYYAMSLANRHGGYIKYGHNLDEANVFNAIWYSITVYISHVKWVFESILVDGANVYGNAFLNQVFWILSSRGGLDLSLIGFELDWENSGKWLSIPGAVWHDYGILGLAMISCLFYFLYLLACFFIAKLSSFNIGVQYFLIVFITLFFSIFIISPFSSLLSVVEFIYVFLDVVLIFSFMLFKNFLRVSCQ